MARGGAARQVQRFTQAARFQQPIRQRQNIGGFVGGRRRRGEQLQKRRLRPARRGEQTGFAQDQWRGRGAICRRSPQNIQGVVQCAPTGPDEFRQFAGQRAVAGRAEQRLTQGLFAARQISQSTQRPAKDHPGFGGVEAARLGLGDRIARLGEAAHVAQGRGQIVPGDRAGGKARHRAPVCFQRRLVISDRLQRRRVRAQDIDVG